MAPTSCKEYYVFLYRTDYGEGENDCDIYVAVQGNDKFADSYELLEFNFDNYLSATVVDSYREYDFHYIGKRCLPNDRDERDDCVVVNQYSGILKDLVC